MDKNLLIVLVMYWVISAVYVIYEHNIRGTLSLNIIIAAIILGPIMALFVKDDDHTIKKHHDIEENENDRHMKWFRTMGEINRERRPSWYRSIPPPPPISRIERAQTERENAIRLALERTEPPNRRPNNKDFKFFQK
jgi:hypothetical protein